MLYICIDRFAFDSTEGESIIKKQVITIQDVPLNITGGMEQQTIPLSVRVCGAFRIFKTTPTNIHSINEKNQNVPTPM